MKKIILGRRVICPSRPANQRIILYIWTVRPQQTLFNYSTFDSFLAGLGKKLSVQGSCCSAKTAHQNKTVLQGRQQAVRDNCLNIWTVILYLCNSKPNGYYFQIGSILNKTKHTKIDTLTDNQPELIMNDTHSFIISKQ